MQTQANGRSQFHTIPPLTEPSVLLCPPLSLRLIEQLRTQTRLKEFGGGPTCDSLLLLCQLVKEDRGTKEAEGVQVLAQKRFEIVAVVSDWFSFLFYYKFVKFGALSSEAHWIKVSLGKKRNPKVARNESTAPCMIRMTRVGTVLYKRGCVIYSFHQLKT